MKMISSGLLVFASLLCGCASAPVASIKSSDNSVNANTAPDNPTSGVVKSMNSLKIGRVNVSRAGTVTAVLENLSKQPIKVWKDSNSWGAACWRVLLIRKGEIESFFQNPDQAFTKNWPAFNEIPPGGHVEYNLDPNGGNWCGLGYCSGHNQRGFGVNKLSFEPNDMVIVIYDVPATEEARNLGVWYGVVSASTTVQ